MKVADLKHNVIHRILLQQLLAYFNSPVLSGCVCCLNHNCIVRKNESTFSTFASNDILEWTYGPYNRVYASHFSQVRNKHTIFKHIFQSLVKTYRANPILKLNLVIPATVRVFYFLYSNACYEGLDGVY